MSDLENGRTYGLVIVLRIIIESMASEEQKHKIMRELQFWLNMRTSKNKPMHEFIDGVEEVIKDVMSED